MYCRDYSAQRLSTQPVTDTDTDYYNIYEKTYPGIVCLLRQDSLAAIDFPTQILVILTLVLLNCFNCIFVNC